jgi:hypothetical protein
MELLERHEKHALHGCLWGGDDRLTAHSRFGIGSPSLRRFEDAWATTATSVVTKQHGRLECRDVIRHSRYIRANSGLGGRYVEVMKQVYV